MFYLSWWRGGIGGIHSSCRVCNPFSSTWQVKSWRKPSKGKERMKDLHMTTAIVPSLSIYSCFQCSYWQWQLYSKWPCSHLAVSFTLGSRNIREALQWNREVPFLFLQSQTCPRILCYFVLITKIHRLSSSGDFSKLLQQLSSPRGQTVQRKQLPAACLCAYTDICLQGNTGGDLASVPRLGHGDGEERSWVVGTSCPTARALLEGKVLPDLKQTIH